MSHVTYVSVRRKPLRMTLSANPDAHSLLALLLLEKYNSWVCLFFTLFLVYCFAKSVCLAAYCYCTLSFSWYRNKGCVKEFLCLLKLILMSRITCFIFLAASPILITFPAHFHLWGHHWYSFFFFPTNSVSICFDRIPWPLPPLIGNTAAAATASAATVHID